MEKGDVVLTDALTDATAWLRGYLADAPRPVMMVQYDAEKAGYSWPTLERAKEHLRVVTTLEGSAEYWRLPRLERWRRYSDMDAPTPACPRCRSDHLEGLNGDRFCVTCGWKGLAVDTLRADVDDDDRPF